MPSATNIALELSMGAPDTQELLLRARDIDPAAWASPLHDHLAKRRSESMKKAHAEFKPPAGRGDG